MLVEGNRMSKSDSKDVTHTSKDGQVRHVEPVYFRELVDQTGKRQFVRKAWYCCRCGYGSWAPA
jgi:hypothetical protein